MTNLSVKMRSGEMRAIDMEKFKSVIKTNKDMMMFFNRVKAHCDFITEQIEAIEEEENPDTIDTYISLIEMSCEYNGKDWIRIGYPDPNEGTTVRDSIRNGDGDFIRIQKKCIDLGLV